MAEKDDQTICLFQTVGERDETPMVPCRQERNMISMEVAVKTIADAVNEIRDGQKENNKLMRDIAVQGTRMNSVEKALDVETADRKHVNDILFTRVQALEAAPVEAARTRQSGLWGAIISTMVAAAVAILISLVKK